MTASGARTTGGDASRAYALASIPPQPFGKYTLIGKLGHGGMAEVNLAVADGKGGFRKLVVIKRLHAHLAMEPGFVDMFLDEARLAARLNHPHCVQTYEVGDWEGSHFLAMEYLDGQGLERLLRICGQQDRPIPIELAARIVSDALDGLAYAHELTDFDGTPLSVVHRDVSPQNIFVTYNGMVKLLDFGIAKAATHVVETKTGVIKGKYAYIAPEQALGVEVDARSDLWSMGVVLWEVLTGRRLFKSVNEIATLQETLQGDVKLPSAFRPELPPELDTICMRALQRDPNDRYQTAQEMKDDLDRFLLSLSHAPGRRQLSVLMKDRFSEVIAAHKSTLAHCLEGSGRHLSSSALRQLVDSEEGAALSSHSGIRAQDVGLTTPTPLSSRGELATAPLHTVEAYEEGTPSGAGASPPPPRPAQPRQGGGWGVKVAALAAVAVLAAGVALLLPIGLGGEEDAIRPLGAMASSTSTAADPAIETVAGDGPERGEGPAEDRSDGPGEPTLGAGMTAGSIESERGAAERTGAQRGQGSAGEADEAGHDEDGHDGHSDAEEPASEARGEAEGGRSEGRAGLTLRQRRRAARLRARQRAQARQARREEQASEAERPQPAAAVAAEPGFLTLATNPWTSVSIGGRSLGTTPLIGVELAPGTHLLRLTNAEAGVNETYRVTIRSGERVTRRLGLQ